MPLRIVRNDITNMHVDAIVSAANPLLTSGGGVDGCIRRAAGPTLLAECGKLDGCETGGARITGAGELSCKYVIHAAGPRWEDGRHGEPELLASCYRTALALAEEAGCETVAFPLISSGASGYPKEQALRVAVDTISAFVLEHEMTVYLVIFDRSAYQIGGKLFSGISAYIDEHYVDAHSSRRKKALRPIPLPKTRGKKGIALAGSILSELLASIPTAKSSEDTPQAPQRPPFPEDAQEQPDGQAPIPQAPQRPPLPEDAPQAFQRPPFPEEAPRVPQRPPFPEDAPRVPQRPSSPKDAPQASQRPSSPENAPKAFVPPASFENAPLRPDEYASVAQASQLPPSLDDALKQLDESFSEMLLRKIDGSGMTDAQFYKKANIDRKHFSKIRGSRFYRPSKPTAIASAIALELSLEETKELLMKAGFALSHSNKFDIIVEYFIQNGNYNIFEINEALFAFDQSLLGA